MLSEYRGEARRGQRETERVVSKSAFRELWVSRGSMSDCGRVCVTVKPIGFKILRNYIHPSGTRDCSFDLDRSDFQNRSKRSGDHFQLVCFNRAQTPDKPVFGDGQQLLTLDERFDFQPILIGGTQR